MAKTSRRHCDECQNFPKVWPEAPFELPKQNRGESDWKFQERLRRFGKTLELEPEYVCLAGRKMAFRMPNGLGDRTWGFFKDNCRSFVDQEVTVSDICGSWHLTSKERE